MSILLFCVIVSIKSIGYRAAVADTGMMMIEVVVHVQVDTRIYSVYA
jgi:hypothetical protein